MSALKSNRVFLYIFLMALVSPSVLKADVDAVLWVGSELPDGSGTFTAFGLPVLNDAGQLVFTSEFANSNGAGSAEALVKTNIGVTNIELIARTGQPASESGDVFVGDFARPSISNAGHTAFLASFMNSSGVSEVGLFREHLGVTIKIAETGQTAPNGDGFFGPFLGIGSTPTINDSGQIGFNVELVDTANGGSATRRGMYVHDASGLSLIARTDPPFDLILTANHVREFIGGSSLQGPAINNAGTVAIAALVDDQSLTNGRHMLLRKTQESSTLEIALDGGPRLQSGSFNIRMSGSSSGEFGSGVAMNESSQLACAGFIQGTDPLEEQFIRTTPVPDAPDEVLIIASKGDPAPVAGGGSSGSFGSGRFGPTWAINDHGQTLFYADTSDGDGLFFWDESQIFAVARAGQLVPCGVGEFDSAFLDSTDLIGRRRTLAFNNSGQVVFHALIDVPDSFNDLEGLYFWTAQSELTQIVRRGSSLFGSTVTSFAFSSGNNERAAERSGFNNAGHVAFRFKLQDGREGIAIYTPATQNEAFDIDLDGKVNESDFVVLVRCMAGPDASSPENCDSCDASRSDFDNDNDVDLNDAAIFLSTAAMQS